MIYKYDQLSQRISYNQALKINKYENKYFHIGQLKLLFCEIFFISKFLHKNPIKVVYVGAGSEGFHNTLLADLFPSIKFDLWDPGQFNVEKRPNIEIFNNFFTDIDAKEYAKQNSSKILFMSDIRNLEIAEYKKGDDDSNRKMDQIVINDMDNQMKWTKIINPMASYLKFRLPYFTDKFEYFSGTIYLQPYSPSSTENRIIVTNYSELKTYNVKEYDEKMSYFNFFIRPVIKYKKWKNIMNKHKIINNWDNSYAFHILHYYLLKTKKKTDDDNVAKLFMRCINFYNKLNDRKTARLFSEIE